MHQFLGAKAWSYIFQKKVDEHFYSKTKHISHSKYYRTLHLLQLLVQLFDIQGVKNLQAPPIVLLISTDISLDYDQNQVSKHISNFALAFIRLHLFFLADQTLLHHVTFTPPQCNSIAHLFSIWRTRDKNELYPSRANCFWVSHRTVCGLFVAKMRADVVELQFCLQIELLIRLDRHLFGLLFMYLYKTSFLQ